MKERKDLWSAEEDQLLTETVLQYVTNEDTKTSAFKKAAEKLGRSISACQYRWNVVLKKKANETTLPNLQEKPQAVNVQRQQTETEAPIHNLNQVIHFLEIYAKQHPESKLAQENKLLEKENLRLNEKNQQLNEIFNEKKEDYDKELAQYEAMAKVLGEAKTLLKNEGLDEKRMVH